MGYDRWAAKYNLKQMAATVTAYQQYGFSSPEELDEACSAAYTAMRESLTELKQVEKTLDGKKELQRQVLAYSKTRPVRDGLKQQKNAKAKAAYRQKHESDFIIADAAARYFRENGISKLPSYKALQAEIEALIKEKKQRLQRLPGKTGGIPPLTDCQGQYRPDFTPGTQACEKAGTGTIKTAPKCTRTYTEQGGCPVPYPQYQRVFLTGLQGRKTPKMIPR